jgi:REP element-mobilizing transposase RayT
MEKKEYYKHNLPHFQQPGQSYFVTWSLKDAVPKKALKRYTQQLEILKLQMVAADLVVADSLPDGQTGDSLSSNRRSESATPDSTPELQKLQIKYYSLRKKYIKAYDDLLDAERNPKIDLSKPENLGVMQNTLKFWESKKLKNHAFCIMPNHVHWVFELLEKDEKGEIVYLQDVMYSIKRFSASEINKLEKRGGKLWQKESFDTTIRDEKHLYYAIEYTLNNPVKAGLVSHWHEWPGSWCTK